MGERTVADKFRAAEGGWMAGGSVRLTAITPRNEIASEGEIWPLKRRNNIEWARKGELARGQY